MYGFDLSSALVIKVDATHMLLCVAPVPLHVLLTCFYFDLVTEIAKMSAFREYCSLVNVQQRAEKGCKQL